MYMLRSILKALFVGMFFMGVFLFIVFLYDAYSSSYYIQIHNTINRYYDFSPTGLLVSFIILSIGCIGMLSMLFKD